jgi:DNA-binding transcriptional ArsR family regulator
MVDESNDDRLDRTFGALADPTRRRMLVLVREAGALRVGNLAAAFDMSLNGASKHIKVLERAGLVQREVRGRVHWIRPDPAGALHALGWLSEHHQFWRSRLRALDTH